MKNILSLAVALALLTVPAVSAADDSRELQAARAVGIALILLNSDEEGEQTICNLNEDSAEEINSAIPDINMDLAGRIVSYRENNGPYLDMLDLLGVPGLDSKIVHRNRHRFTL